MPGTAKAYLAAIVESSDDAILSKDLNGIIQSCNPAGDARKEDRSRAFRAGYQAHLAKPIEPAELVDTISSFAGLIESRRRARDADM